MSTTNITLMGQQLAAVLTAIQQNSQPAFIDVLRRPSTSFTGYPSVTILPTTGQTGNFEDVKQNERIYGFDILIYNIGDQNEQTVWDLTTDLTTLVMDALDKTIDLNGLVDFIMPVVGDFGVLRTASGSTLISTIKVFLKTTVQLS